MLTKVRTKVVAVRSTSSSILDELAVLHYQMRVDREWFRHVGRLARWLSTHVKATPRPTTDEPSYFWATNADQWYVAVPGATCAVRIAGPIPRILRERAYPPTPDMVKSAVDLGRLRYRQVRQAAF